MFKGIIFKEFLNNFKEWHALTFGFCETMCPEEPRYPEMSDVLKKQIEWESHYYRFGRVIGYILRRVFLAGLVLGTTAGVAAIVRAICY